jgi:acyl-CoA synthetase (AMP-forming)/AMP-acid ligase II
MNRPRPFAARPDTRFVELARQRAIDAPDLPLAPHLPLRYDRLDRRARAVAAKLQTRTRPGDRVLLLETDPCDFVVAWLACLYAEVVAVCAELSPPGTAAFDDRLSFIGADAVPALVLADHTVEALSHLPRLALSDVDDDDAADWRATFPDHGTPAMLRYTEATWPDAVLLTHGDLLANLRDIRSGLGADTARDVGLLATVLAPFRRPVPGANRER